MTGDSTDGTADPDSLTKDEERKALAALSLAETFPVSDEGEPAYQSSEFIKKTPGKSYLKFANREEELEWIENNDFINRVSPFIK